MEQLKSKTDHAGGYIRFLRTALRKANERADYWRNQTLANADKMESLESNNKALQAETQTLKMQVEEWRGYALANLDRCNAFMEMAIKLNADTEGYFAKMVKERSELIALRMSHPEIFNESETMTTVGDELTINE